MSDIRDLARAVLLAFADLGIYLPTPRERVMLKARSLDVLDRTELEDFLDACIEADLVSAEEAGRLRLSPTEAKRLAASLDGHTPVPDEQAVAWASRMGNPA